ncbi:MAG: hypothetical protein AB8B55_08280 [Mariniblastus sp.]
MARKRPARSRASEFKSQQRKSWVRFITKISLFVVPILVGSVWLVLFLLRSGQTLPIMVLDYEADKENRLTDQVWNKVGFLLTGESDKIVLAQDSNGQLTPGGPNNDVVVVFSDLLGSARSLGEGESPVACIFKPSTAEEHRTHAYRGLLNNETAAELKQWVPVEDYLKTIVQGVKDKSKVNPNVRGKIIIVLDVDHPDLPARLPPQANEFISLCKKQWARSQAELNEEFDVFVWLSHSEGQKSYYDSSYDLVDSIFKRRFEFGITGDVLNLKNRKSKRDIYYSDLKRYMLQWVQSDSDVHKLAQTPSFLEPAGELDFAMLRLKDSAKASAKVGAIFDYPARKKELQNGMEDLDSLWGRYESVKRNAGWTLENPLLSQRATMLLLQLERLWFVGRAESTLFSDLHGELQSILETETTIQPVKHTAYDGWAAAANKNFDSFDLTNWLPAPPLAEGEELPLAEEIAAKKVEKERKETVEQWQSTNSDWAGAMGLWVAIRDAKDDDVTLSNIAVALSQISDGQRYVSHADSAEGLSKICWNEIAYLERLVGELRWPTDENERKEFGELVQLSIKNRDLANEFAAKLAPALTLEFKQAFGEYENRRRVLEDRLFANDFVVGQKSLKSELRELQREYEKLLKRHEDLKREFERLQSALISAPHDLRYAMESLAVQAQSGAEKDRRVRIAEFASWSRGGSDGEEGFQTAWNSLCGNQTLELVLKRADDSTIDQGEYTTRFEALRRKGFSTANSSGESEAQTKAQTKGLATNPYVDNETFNRWIVETGNQPSNAMKVADGNLLARRLLLWPGFELSQREAARDGLTTMKVETSGRTDETEANKDLDFANAEISQQLVETLRDQPMNLMTASNASIPFSEPNADFFSDVAFGAHRLLIKRSEDQTTENVLIAINDFRSEKSDFDFNRVANDLWATPPTNTDNFVNSALRNHRSLTFVRVDNIHGRMETIEKLRTNWETKCKASWKFRSDSVREFGENFQRWKWKQNQQKAFNQPLVEPIQSAENDGNSFTFSLSPKERNYNTIFRGNFDLENQWLEHRRVSGNKLWVYLRGHLADVDVVQRVADRESVPFDIDMQNRNLSGAKLIVKRAKLGPISGHITLVIDCSGSMVSKSGNRMTFAKQQVNQFLERISKRGDISVSLVAIGLVENWNPKKDGGNWDYKNESDFPSWERVKKPTDPSTAPKSRDVFVYEDQEKIVNKNTLPGLKKAINELQAFGETPILAGLDKALSLSSGGLGRPNLIVLLTDGFEFGNRGREPDQIYAPMDESLYGRIKQKQAEVGGELVVFNFLSSSIGVYFKSIIDAGVTASEIETRIEKIKSLATIKANASDTTLEAFLSGLLPQPVVFFEGDGMKMIERQIKLGIDARDAGKSEAEQGTMAVIGLSSNDRPEKWSAGVKFRQREMGRAAESFAKPPSKWNSNARIEGNELLEFQYDPFSPSFELSTGIIQQPKEVEVSTPSGGMALLVGETKQRNRKPEFEVRAKDGNKLTPAVAMAFVTFSQSGNPKDTVLLQDINFKQQIRSNVHPLEFGEFQNAHRRATFDSRKPVDMRLHLVRSFPAQFWSKVMFDDEDVWSMTSANRKQNINRRDYVSLANYLPKSRPFSDYKISVRRDNNQTETADYWVKIESVDKDVPLDRWLIQVLNEDGEIERGINQQSRRRYVFRELSDGTRELAYIQHRFRIVKNELTGSKAFFGFAHLDEVEKDAAKVDYQNHFDGK